MYYTYDFYSDSHKNYYVGISADVGKRLLEHNKGNTRSTKPYIPWRLVHVEVYENRILARKREKYLKTAAGRKWRKENIDLGD